MTMPAMRAQASAIYIGIITIVASLGPIIVSLLIAIILVLIMSACSSQIPGIMEHASFLDPCSNGVGYSLLITVPSFYFLAAVLFALLGIVMACWGRRTGATEIAYKEVTDKVQKDTEVPPMSP